MKREREREREKILKKKKNNYILITDTEFLLVNSSNLLSLLIYLYSFFNGKIKRKYSFLRQSVIN